MNLFSSFHCTFVAASLFALIAAACGDSEDGVRDDGVSVGPDHVPDERANPELRNDCFEVSGKALPDDLLDSAGEGPIARFTDGSWTSLRGESRESSAESGMVSRTWSSSSFREANAACGALMPIFLQKSQGSGKDEVFFETRLVHEVTGFVFPADLRSAPPVDTAIEVRVTSTLHIDYRHPLVRADGTIDPGQLTTREGEAQAWTLETTCATPFTVTPRWEARTAMPEQGAQYCTTGASGGVACLVFTFNYSGDRCSFVARDQSIRLTSGETIEATFAGYFDRRPSAGYSIVVTNVEIR